MKNSKHVLFIFAFLLSAILSQAQTPSNWYSPQLLFDTTIYDNNGTRYSLDNIKIDTVSLNGTGQRTQLISSTTCSTTNYFNLYFEPGCGMEIVGNTTHDNRRNNLIQLFCDLSAFITNKGGVSNKVNIWVRNPNNVIASASSSGVTASASGFFSYPYNTAKSGIMDNEIWKTINSGQDSYIGIAAPLISTGSFYHGVIAFNFANSLNSFHDNLSTNPTGSELDLYTLGLHEMMHAMGFITAIYYNGNSKITNISGNSSNYYTRYDQFLKTQTGVSLITNSTSCSMYQFNFNSSLTATAVLSPSAASCGSVLPSFGYLNATTCSTSIMYTGGSQNINVYTPNCYEFVSSLSHFEDMCYPTNNPSNNDQYFVMCSGNTPGMMKRYLKEEERKVLCDIGYSVAATYGTASYTTTQKTYTAGSCNGLGVVGVNDGLGTGGVYTYTTTVGVGTSVISPLTNDVGTSGGSYECLEIVNGSGTLQNTAGTSFTYNPSGAGLHLLRYIPKSSTGVKGNITYIYVKVIGTTSTCPTPNNCEMVYNGGFESASTTCGESDFVPASGPFIDCWSVISNFFRYYLRNCSTNSPINLNSPSAYSIPGVGESWNGSPNNAYIYSQFPGTVNRLVMEGNLTSSLVPTSQYKESFWVRSDNPAPNVVPNLVVNLSAASSPVVGPVPTSSTIPSPFVSIATFTIPNDGLWHNCSSTFTYSGASPARYIYLMSLNSYTPGISGYSLDDVSILPLSAACTFTMPAISCTGATYTLNSMVSVPNGTFSGAGVSYSSPNYIFDANSAGNGLQTISYTYTTATGCTLTAIAQTSVTPTPTAITIVANPPAGLCSSYPTATLTASGASTYTFNNGVTSTYTNPAVVSPTATTVYTITGANATCSLSTTYTVNYTSACVCTAASTVASTLSNTIISASQAVTGNVTISTGTVMFSAVDMRCSPGVSITVASGATLTITQSHLYSCFDMWQGIDVQPGGYLKLNTSLIEDAQQAVRIYSNTSTSGTVLDVYGTTFNRCQTGVAVSNYTQALATYPFVVKQSIFTSRNFTFTPTSWPSQATLSQTCAVTNTLASPFCIGGYPVINMKSPNNSTTAYYGITLVNVGATTNPSTTPTYYSFQAGDASNVTYLNIYDNLFYGISATNSNLKVAFSAFQNSQSQQMRGNWIGGVGVFSTSDDYNNNYLNLKAPSPYYTTRKNKFYDCTYAVRTSNTFELNAQYMVVQSTQSASTSYQRGKYGVYSTSNRFNQYDVQNNLIYNIENGITFNSNYGTITFGASTYTNTQYSGLVYLNLNTIAPVASGAIGTEFVSNAITAMNVLSAGSTNTMTSNSQVNASGNVMRNVYRGINASNFYTPAFMAQNNTCTLTLDPGNNLQQGIAITTCSNASVQTNVIVGPSTSNTITTGIYASMNNTPKVTCNTVSVTYQGFQLDGVQPGTKWKGNSMTTHTLGMALTTGTIGAQGSSGNPSDNAWNGSWSLSNYQTYTSASTATDSPLWVQNTTVYNPSNNWGSPPTTSYFAGGTFTTTGAYSCAGGGARLMGNITDDYEASYIELLEKIAGSNANLNNKFDVNTFIAQYHLFKALDFNSDLKTKSNILSNYYTNNKLTEYGKILNGHNDLINGNYSSAISSLNSVPSKNNVETNYSNFYSLYSKYCSSSFTDGDNANLLILANKCPVLEGEVIYEARALYNIANSTVALFKNNCPDLTISSARLNNNNTTSQNVWTANIYPIPASNELFIGTNITEENVSINIIDVNGRTVYENNVKTSNSVASIKLDMSSGIYFVTLSNANGDKVIKKLVIAK